MEILELLEQILTEDFCRFALALTLLMLSNLITGIMKAVKAGEFSWRELFNGVFRYILWLLGCTIGVIGAQIYGGDLEVIVGDAQLTLLDAIEYAKKAVYIYWGAKFIQNFLEYSKMDKSVSAVDPKEDIVGPQEVVGQEDLG